MRGRHGRTPRRALAPAAFAKSLGLSPALPDGEAGEKEGGEILLVTSAFLHRVTAALAAAQQLLPFSTSSAPRTQLLIPLCTFL